MNYETIILEKKDNIATLTLNRPERLNAISEEMFPELLSAIADVDDDDEMRVLVLTGAGRGFCSGRDAGGRAQGERERAPRGPEEGRQGILKGPTWIMAGLQKMETPTIAMVNGIAAGVGCDLAFSCDMRVGSENARFVNAYVRMGMSPGAGGCWLYPRVMGLGKALQYLFTGDFIEAKEAEKLGVLNELVPAEKLEEVTIALAGKIAKGPPIAMKLMKFLTYTGLEMDFEAALRYAAACEVITLGSEDVREGAKAFGERRPPKFQGK